MPVTPEEQEELEESFRYNDSNADGKIGFDEFLAMLGELDAGMDRGEARIGFEAIDTDRDGGIELDEFMAWWSEK